MDNAVLSHLISGAIVMGYAVVGLFFGRFWKQSRDRLFLFFSLAFWVLGAQRLGLALAPGTVEDTTIFYVVRLLAFVLILAAIVDKNRARRPPA
jgi:hypothetical protein